VTGARIPAAQKNPCVASVGESARAPCALVNALFPSQGQVSILTRYFWWCLLPVPAGVVGPCQTSVSGPPPTACSARACAHVPCLSRHRPPSGLRAPPDLRRPGPVPRLPLRPRPAGAAQLPARRPARPRGRLLRAAHALDSGDRGGGGLHQQLRARRRPLGGLPGDLRLREPVSARRAAEHGRPAVLPLFTPQLCGLDCGGLTCP